MSKDQALVREFIFRERADWDRFVAFMGANLAPMAEAKRYLRAVVSEYKATRSTEANAYMWAGLLVPISEQAMVAGQRYTAEVWSEFFKAQFLPEVTARGTEKWLYLPDGSRKLFGSTSHLNQSEMAQYLDRIAEYAVHDLGVHLPANPRDYRE